MRELVARYPAVTYFVVPKTRRLITSLADEIGAGRVQVLPLPEAKR